MGDIVKQGDSIATRMSRAARSVGYGVRHDGENSFHRYRFTSAGNVKKHVGPALAAEGIAVSSAFEVLHMGGLSGKGGPSQYMVCRATLTFVCDGGTLTAQGLGAGSDRGDKAPMKAQTAAEKYAYVSAFTIAMGEDPEADESTDEHAAGQEPDPHSYDNPEHAEESKRAVAIADGFLAKHCPDLEQRAHVVAKEYAKADEGDRVAIAKSTRALMVAWFVQHADEVAEAFAHPHANSKKGNLHRRLLKWATSAGLPQTTVREASEEAAAKRAQEAAE